MASPAGLSYSCPCLLSLLLLLMTCTWSCSAQDDVGATHFASTEDLLTSSPYSSVIEPTLKPVHLEDLPGFTRSAVHKDHALITPESQVFGPLPGWANTLAAYFITPALGAHFSMYIARMAGNASSAAPGKGIERFIFILSGRATLKHGEDNHQLGADSYAYAAADEAHRLSTTLTDSAVAVVIERPYTPLPGVDAPTFVVGSTDEQPVVPVPGEVFVLRKLLPPGAPYDFNIHVMDFMPGEYLNVKEVHYNQHGLLLLEGRGIYRLADNWYPVQAGDVIWMAPFVPQWYAALGKTRSRYLLYKDTNRDPLVLL